MVLEEAHGWERDAARMQSWTLAFSAAPGWRSASSWATEEEATREADIRNAEPIIAASGGVYSAVPTTH